MMWALYMYSTDRAAQLIDRLEHARCVIEPKSEFTADQVHQ